jgi:hypothetical protein
MVETLPPTSRRAALEQAAGKGRTDMRISVSEAARQLEERGLLTRERKDHSDKVIEHVRKLLGRELPPDLIEFLPGATSRPLGSSTRRTPGGGTITWVGVLPTVS